MIFGKLIPSRNAYPLVAEHKLATSFFVGEVGYLTKLTAYIDGHGTADRSQVAQAFVYDTDEDKLLGVSKEVEVPQFQDPAWVDFPFDSANPPYIKSAGMYDVGLIGGPASGLIRIYGDDPSLRGGREGNDSYLNGPTEGFGTDTGYTHDLSIFATGFRSWAPPVETDFYYARLPFSEAQTKLSETGLVARTAITASANWHGSALDGEMGSFCLVNRHSVFADRLGHRLKITRKFRGRKLSVYAYCHGWTVMEDDITLTRELFVRIAPLSADFVIVSVQTMGPVTR